MSERFGHAALSSGDIFRAEIGAGTSIGRQASEFVKSGRLVPDEIVTAMMLVGIGKLGPDARFILDGYPRTIPQAEGLAAGLDGLNAGIDTVVDFRIADPVIIERAVNRRVCKNCGRSYNVRFFPPRVGAVCDQCGGVVVQRDDDREDVIRTRLETYYRQTQPLVDHYTRAGLLRVVDASAAADDVESAVAAIVEASGRA
jgi:adenylate kinase